MNFFDMLYVIIMFFPLIIILKGIYDIYWTGEKANLKEKPVVKYGLAILLALFVTPFLLRI